MKKIRLGGVPEHFNLPIHLAKERGQFERQGIDLQWATFAGGTGQMTKALRNGEVDACILLTEGIIKDILHGNPSKIISLYVQTPLIWGVHTGSKNELLHYEDIFDKKYAISRFGSGSHLMAIVDANSKGHSLQEKSFNVIKNLEGALTSLDQLESDIFYWEKFTTKPYVDAGQLRRIGEYLTPWPCFVIAATDDLLNRHPQAVVEMLKVIHQSAHYFMLNPQATSLVSQRYHLQMKDVERWFHSTEWATHGWVSDKMIESVIFHLNLAGILDKSQTHPELIWRR